MEQTKEINGLTVYVGGTWFEISLPQCGGVMYSGTCSPNTAPQLVYDRHFPLSPKDGWVHSRVTLLFSGGTEIYSIHAGYALLNISNYHRPQDGYCLWYSAPRSHIFHTVTFKPKSTSERPLVIAAKRYIALPSQFPVSVLENNKQQETNFDTEIPIDSMWMDRMTSYLDNKGIAWAEM